MVESLTENYVFAGICVPLGVFYFIMAMMNLLGERLGSPGRRFIFEMDAVMGGLLGIPHYSKLEFVFLLFTSAGFWLTWVHDPEVILVTVLGILTGAIYMLVCVFYAIYARQNKVVFLIPCFVNLALLIWRSVRSKECSVGLLKQCFMCFRFLDPDYYVAVGVCGGIGVAISLISLMVMRSRAKKCEATVEKLLQIQKYETSLKSKNEKLVWKRGKDSPEGFQITT